MSTRTVRFDDNTEAVLKSITQSTGLSISDAIKKGLLTLQRELNKKRKKSAFDIYNNIDLSKCEKDIPLSTNTRTTVKQIIEKKYNK